MRSAGSDLSVLGFGRLCRGSGRQPGKIQRAIAIDDGVDLRLLELHFTECPGPMQQRGGQRSAHAQQIETRDRTVIRLGERELADFEP